ncbi:MAG TPA: PRC-barrel domain-containing protein [Solirubrobacterales bacterium]|nr:PRC-barrel domain-containing protein [Solirubrobacterales bacterium]
MDDLGERSSYLVVAKGVPVFSSDGEEIGRVVEVLADAKDDMFDGIIFDASAASRGHRFVDAPEVGEIYERGVILKIDAGEAAKLGKPGKNPALLEVSPDDVAGEPPPGFLRRAWNLLSGKG